MTLEIRSVVQIPYAAAGDILVQLGIGVVGEEGQSQFNLLFTPLNSLKGRDRLLTGVVIGLDKSTPDDIEDVCTTILDTTKAATRQESVFYMSRVSDFEFQADPGVLDRVASSELRLVTDVMERSAQICVQHSMVYQSVVEPDMGIASVCEGSSNLIRYIVDVYSFEGLASKLTEGGRRWITLPKSALISSPSRAHALAALFHEEWTEVLGSEDWKTAWKLLAWHGWPVGPGDGAIVSDTG